MERRDVATGKATFTVGAFDVARDKDERNLLCQLRDNGRWNLAGGVLDHGLA